jgi:death-on-curing protein
VTEYLELDELLHMIKVAELGPIRDVGLLEAALARPATTVYGVDAYPDLVHKAAALMHSIVKNHALMDGNKRLGWLAAVVFVGFNGYRVAMEQDEAFTLTWEVADGTRDTVEKIAEGLTLVARGA